jgi:hypothetical protein
MIKCSIIALVCGLLSSARAVPTDEYFRNFTKATTWLTTLEGKNLPAQNFRRVSAVATFDDGEKRFEISVFKVSYGDWIYFFQMGTDIKKPGSQPGVSYHQGEARGFYAKDNGTIGETLVASDSIVESSEEGSLKAIYNGDGFGEGAHSVSKTTIKPNGSRLIKTEFLNVNQKTTSGEALITNETLLTYSVPVTLETFKTFLPANLKNYLDSFLILHRAALQLRETISSCSQDCENLQAKYLEVYTQRQELWASLKPADVAALKPVKPPIIKKLPNPPVARNFPFPIYPR